MPKLTDIKSLSSILLDHKFNCLFIIIFSESKILGYALIKMLLCSFISSNIDFLIVFIYSVYFFCLNNSFFSDIFLLIFFDIEGQSTVLHSIAIQITNDGSDDDQLPPLFKTLFNATYPITNDVKLIVSIGPIVIIIEVSC